ncbi:MAG: hypothetical protein CVV42_17230 [Candidatus Riflebacteria bacterium HGW-Riflebacteria-2]|nr:MAG: hypothetical protein CVV42_17230 [Candidatus Riflebacteria bacterium HGW-Riflebacteria-2]
MGVSYTIEEGVVVFVLEGQNTVKQAEEAFREAFTDPAPGFFSILIDARKSLRHRDLSEVSLFAELLTTYRGHIKGRAALVMDENRPKSMELERRLAGFSIREKIEFALFYDIALARDWIKEATAI